MKKIFSITMIMVLVFLLSSCSRGDVNVSEFGSIEELEQNIKEDESVSQIEDVETAVIEEEEYLKNGYGHFKIKIPKWDCVHDEVNVMKYVDGQNTLYIEVAPSIYSQYNNSFDESLISNFLDGRIYAEEFEIGGNKYVRRPNQALSYNEGLPDIQENEFRRYRYDFEKILLTPVNSGVLEDLELSERRYLIFTKHCSIVFSLVSDDYETACGILDEIIRSYEEYSEELPSQEIFVLGHKITIPEIMNHQEGTYRIDSNKKSIMSGTVMFYSERELNDEEIFSYAFPNESDYCNNTYMRYKNTEGVTGDSVNKTVCLIYRTSLGGDRMISHLMSYYFEAIKIEGGYIYIGYPEYAYGSLRSGKFFMN